MILKKAVKDYLSRRLDDHLWIKKAKPAQLDEALQVATCNVHPIARRHQKACVLLGINYPRFSFWLEMGTGKTLITLELLRYWWEAGVVRRALVFVTSDKAFPTWERQIVEYEIGLPFVSLDAAASVDKWQQLQGLPEGIILATYPGSIAMVTDSVRSRGKTRWRLNPDLVAQLGNVDALVMDESTRAGHPTSLTHQLCWEIAQKVDIRYALAGRPFGRDPSLLWAQQLIVDGGKSLGPTLGLFHAAFFTKPQEDKPKFRKPMMPQLRTLARHRSITYTAKECIDLPAYVPIKETVKLPREAGAYYRRVIDQIKAAQGNLREMKNAFIRMRQLSSGFMGLKDDDTGERVQIAFSENPKLDRLLELLEDLPEDHGAVVFYQFTFSGRHIVEDLQARGDQCIWLWSGTKDARGELERFQTDPDVRVAVIQNQVGAFSLDGLQHAANYLFFYESPVPCIDRDQAERRLLRQGQKHKVFGYDLIVDGTLDQRILDYHREGADLFKELTANAEKFFG